MKKRILAVVLAFVMIFSATSLNLTVLAQTSEPAITLESVPAEKGENVAVKVSITNNPGIWGMDLKISYDKTALSLASVDNGDFFQASEWTQGDLSGEVYILSYEAAGLADVTTQNATLATLNFKVDDNAEPGNYEIKATYNAGDIININFDDIDFQIINGKVTIACKHDGATYLKDEKATSCYEEGYTGDTYCSICDEKITDGEDIPTINHTPSANWSYNTTHHWKICEIVDCGSQIGEEEHKGGNKSCTAQAICSECEQPYGELAPHSYTVPQKDTDNHWNKCANCDATDEKTPHNYDQMTMSSETLKTPASCGEDAIYYYSCICGQVSTTLTFIDTGSVTGNHVDADGNWESDGNKHWHTCECGEVFDEAEHSGGSATCKDQATCTVCQVPYGTINEANHIGGTYLVGEKETSCYEKGYTGDVYCSSCNNKISDGEDINESDHSPATAWSTDENNHWKVCSVIECGSIIDEDVHIGGIKTCTEKAVCSVCGIAYGTTAEHSYTVPQKDVDNHWNKCSTCDDTDIKTPHAYDQQVKNSNTLKKPANCKDDAIYYYSCICGQISATLTFVDSGSATGEHIDEDGKWETDANKHWHTCGCGEIIDEIEHKGGVATCADKSKCSVCDVEYGDKNPSNHSGGTEIKDAVEAKCNAEGYTGDTYCKGCGVKVADGSAIEKIPHVVTTWTVTTEPTTEATGFKGGVCSACSEIVEVVTSKLATEIKNENIEGVNAKIELLGETKLPEDVIFKAENATDSIGVQEMEKVENAIKSLGEFANHKIGVIFDLGLILREVATNGDLIEESEAELVGTVKVTIPIPVDLTKTLKNIKLLHIKDDYSIEEVPFTINNGEAVFEVDGFSYYTFIGTKKSSGHYNPPAQNNETNNTPVVLSPATGDNSNALLWLTVMIASATHLAMCVICGKKKRHDR